MPPHGKTRPKTRGTQPSSRVPSWDDIRFFLAIYRAGSLSAAAELVGVTQPTCGRRLTALEAALGLRLFDRAPDGLRITDEGKALLDTALRMEQSADELALRATLSERDLRGTVRIATTELFACSFLVGALESVRSSYPNIHIELVLSNTETDVLRGDADIGFRFGPQGSLPRPQTLIARKLGEEPFLLYGSAPYLDRRGAPSDPIQLEGHDVVAYLGPHPAAAWCEQAFAQSVVALSAPSMQVTAAAIAAGIGLGVLPKRAAQLFPSLHSLSPAVARATGWLVARPDLRRVPRARVVIDALLQRYRLSPLA
ncbi:MAG: LysR family transcriptional regulator [Polyangiaceae bacterium]